MACCATLSAGATVGLDWHHHQDQDQNSTEAGRGAGVETWDWFLAEAEMRLKNWPLFLFII